MVKSDKNTQELLKKIKEKRLQKRQQQQVSAAEPSSVGQSVLQVSESGHSQEKISADFKCMLDGVEYTVIDKVKFNDSMGCYLINSESGYDILGFIGGRTFKIKSYEELKHKNLQARASEKLQDETIRYIIRISTHKFIVDVNTEEKSIKFVMDLC